MNGQTQGLAKSQGFPSRLPNKKFVIAGAGPVPGSGENPDIIDNFF